MEIARDVAQRLIALQRDATISVGSTPGVEPFDLPIIINA
jgi:hypothetical protein